MYMFRGGPLSTGIINLLLNNLSRRITKQNQPQALIQHLQARKKTQFSLRVNSPSEFFFFLGKISTEQKIKLKIKETTHRTDTPTRNCT
jgi:hypothetical protein